MRFHRCWEKLRFPFLFVSRFFVSFFHNGLLSLFFRRRCCALYLEIALGGEGLLADGALEGLVAGVCSHVDLERRGRGEILIANLAQVLARHACKYTHTRNSLSCPQQLSPEGLFFVSWTLLGETSVFRKYASVEFSPLNGFRREWFTFCQTVFSFNKILEFINCRYNLLINLYTEHLGSIYIGTNFNVFSVGILCIYL